MALFGAKKPAYNPAAVTEFWLWWRSGGEDQISNALASRDHKLVDALITKRIKKISPSLDWETGPGTNAIHRLTLSGAGIPEFAPYAFRWKRSAPAADETWEYVAGRERMPPGKLMSVEMFGRKISFDLFRFGVEIDKTRHYVDVTCFHPEFAAMRRPEAMHLTAMVLDWTMGEADVSRWVSSFEAVDREPAPSTDSAGLLASIAEVEIAPDRPTVGTMQGELNGAQLVGTVKLGARWIDHLPLDSHLCVRIPYEASRGEFGSVEEVDRLQIIDEDLGERLGSRAIKIARVYVSQVCTLHYYVDSEDRNTRDIVAAWASENRVKDVSQTLDPSWQQVRYLTG